MRLEVLPVESNRQWTDFFELRRYIYRDDPNVVFPLRFMEKLLLNEQKHPFYSHAIRQPFLCYRDGKAVGRIVAIKDHLHNEYYGDTVGFFGFFESIDDGEVASALIHHAGKWLVEQGCTSARGPVSPSMKGEFGVVIKGNDDPPFVFMGYSPRYYEDLLLNDGFEIAREFYAYLYDVPKQYEAVMAQEPELKASTDKVMKRYPQLRIGNVDKSNFDEQIRKINVLANKVRSSGWGFLPLTDEELDFMVIQLKKVLDPKTLIVAYWEDKLVGYCINVPCINWALRKSVGRADWWRVPQFLYWMKRTPRTRVIGLGADEDYRRRGVGVILSAEMRYRGTRNLNYQQWEFSWVDSQNQASSKAIGRTMPLIHSKTLRLYEKQLSVAR